MKGSLCICSLCYNRALWHPNELRSCQLLVMIREALLAFCYAKPCTQQPMLFFSVPNSHRGLWMMMLSLNNKYFIWSIYAGMLWSLGDVTEPFNVNFFDVLKKNPYRLRLCGRELDKTWMAGAGPDKIYFCGSGRAGAGQNLAEVGLKNPYRTVLYFKVHKWCRQRNNNIA